MIATQELLRAPRNGPSSSCCKQLLRLLSSARLHLSSPPLSQVQSRFPAGSWRPAPPPPPPATGWCLWGEVEARAGRRKKDARGVESGGGKGSLALARVLDPSPCGARQLLGCGLRDLFGHGGPPRHLIRPGRFRPAGWLRGGLKLSSCWGILCTVFLKWLPLNGGWDVL
jgi:hypothetical protein